MTLSDSKVSEYFYTLPENFDTNISPNENSGSDNSKSEISTLTPFKVSRDYVSGDASEGFEDWSFLDQKRPYDSLIRENIFELLEDLKGPNLNASSRIGRLYSVTDPKKLGPFAIYYAVRR